MSVIERKRRKARTRDANTIFLCTFDCILFVQDGDQKRTIAHKHTIPITRELIDAGPIHVFVKYHKDELKELFPGLVTIAEHHLVATERLDGEPIDDTRLMSRSQLIQYIEEEQLPIQSDYYADLSQLRTAIEECEEDEQGFLKQQERRVQLRGPEAKIRNNLAALTQYREELKEKNAANVSKTNTAVSSNPKLPLNSPSPGNKTAGSIKDALKGV